MVFQRLVWVGLGCCLSALVIQVFPRLAYELGVNIVASWMVFVFGVFLIAVSAIAHRTPPRHHTVPDDVTRR